MGVRGCTSSVCDRYLIINNACLIASRHRVWVSVPQHQQRRNEFHNHQRPHAEFDHRRAKHHLIRMFNASELRRNNENATGRGDKADNEERLRNQRVLPERHLTV